MVDLSPAWTDLKGRIAETRTHQKKASQDARDVAMDVHQQEMHKLHLVLREAKAAGLPDTHIREALKSKNWKFMRLLFEHAGIHHTGQRGTYEIDPNWTGYHGAKKWRGYEYEDGTIEMGGPLN